MEFETVQLLILILVTFLVTEGLKSFSKLLGADLSGYGTAIVAALVALFVGIFQTVLVPLMSPEVALILEPTAQLIITVLSAFGVHKTFKRFQ
jgi:hypothetical protein